MRLNLLSKRSVHALLPEMKTFVPPAILLLLQFFPFSVSAQAPSETPPQISYGNNPAAGRFIHVNDIDIYCEIYGKGEPLLLIHGDGGSIASMENQIPYFAKNYEVIAADSRSQGKTQDPSDFLSYDMMADDCDALMDSLHLKSAFVIGWSDGGIVGLLLAIKHPEKVKKLAVTGANIRSDSTAFSDDVIQDMHKGLARLETQKQDAATKNKIKLTRMMIREPNITHKELGSVQCPVLVIGGDYDVIKPEHTLEIFHAIPHANLWILPGSGHDTLISYKDDFNQQVGRFFEQK